MYSWNKGLGTAIAVTLSLFFWSLTVLYEYAFGPFNLIGIAILVLIGLFFFGWGLFLYRKMISSMGLREAFMRLSVWLVLLLVVIPNTLMSLFLMGIHGGIGFALFAISTGVYYAIPAQFAGEGVFLTETVITPNGAQGILISAMFWALVLIVLLIVVNAMAMVLNRKRSLR